jgi:hypothetical protein
MSWQGSDLGLFFATLQSPKKQKSITEKKGNPK